MKYKKLLFVWMICLPVLMPAQQTADFATIDSVTYRLYVQKNWPALLKTAKAGIKNSIDYYYLRMRKGIAGFELEKYIAASRDFAKAVEFNRHDPTAHSYRYFSLLRSGKKTQAYHFGKTLGQSQKNALGIHIKTVDEVYFFSGYTFSNNNQQNGNLDMLGDSAVYGEQLLMGNQRYSHLGADFNFTPAFSMYASLSYLNISKQNRFQYKPVEFYIDSTVQLAGDSYYNIFGLADDVVEQVFDNRIQQAEVYLNFKWQLNKGWAVNLFTNLLFAGTTQHGASLDSTVRSAVLSYNQPQDTYQYIDITEYDYQITSTDTSFVDWVLGFNLQKDLDFVVVNYTASLSKIYENRQFQSSVSATYYPLGSLKFYGTTNLTWFYEPQAAYSANSSRFIIRQMLGIQIAKRFWFEGEYSYGNLTKVNMKQGMVVYNLPDDINYSAGAKLTIFAGRHITFYAHYRFYDKTGFYSAYINESGAFKTFSTKYQTQQITGGIQWTF